MTSVPFFLCRVWDRYWADSLKSRPKTESRMAVHFDRLRWICGWQLALAGHVCWLGWPWNPHQERFRTDLPGDCRVIRSNRDSSKHLLLALVSARRSTTTVKTPVFMASQAAAATAEVAEFDSTDPVALVCGSRHDQSWIQPGGYRTIRCLCISHCGLGNNIRCDRWTDRVNVFSDGLLPFWVSNWSFA